ncbi:MAG: DUF2130 domain-containing protein [Muribaculaceae bacterium]|nr:DUF2130 domain-containing protein [Muribaculaceae bacterium]
MKLQCPHCKTTFQVDESEYAAIAAQVRGAELEKEVSRRVTELEQRYTAEAEAARLKQMHELQEREALKDREAAELRLQVERLTMQVSSFQTEKAAEMAKHEADAREKMARLKESKDLEINDLRSKLLSVDARHALAMEKERSASRESLMQKEQALAELTLKLKNAEVAAENKIHEINERNSVLLRAKDEEIEHYKDMKSRLSTKLLGETLEIHCRNVFDRARSYGQFINAYFEKDNDASGGSKGDFIFRDYLDGREFISIMFEMKNEDENSVNKHRNADFLDKLHRDRVAKNCEYAVLVSTLEADSELYNEGIVDVSYRYDKMYVVRPQFFMAVISMLSRTARRGAEKLISLNHELEVARAQSIDVTKFEEKCNKFVMSFSKLVESHIAKQDDALARLDKEIEQVEKHAENLRKIRSLFETSKQKLLKANEMAETDLTIKKLTYGNPTMRKKFEDARKEDLTHEGD